MFLTIYHFLVNDLIDELSSESGKMIQYWIMAQRQKKKFLFERSLKFLFERIFYLIICMIDLSHVKHTRLVKFNISLNNETFKQLFMLRKHNSFLNFGKNKIFL